MWRSAVQICLGLQIGKGKIQISILNFQSPEGGLAQLARAPALQAGGQRFESVILHHPSDREREPESMESYSSLFTLHSSLHSESIFDMLDKQDCRLDKSFFRQYS